MKKRFFGTIFAGKPSEDAPAFKAQTTTRNVSTSIKPASDILDFQYPPESSFYKAANDQPAEDAGEVHPNL